VLGACDHATSRTPRQQDALLRLGAVVKAELERSGRGLALISRTGTDLSRFDVRYSHAGLSVRDGLDTPWAVRQLYFSCDERQPRIFDQGMAGFVMGMHEPDTGYVSVVFLPDSDSDVLQRAVLDKPLALQILATDYSANAYPFSQRYQNCNQWVAELLAAARGELPPSADTRALAQQWLKDNGYLPTVFDVQPRPLMWLTPFFPALHRDDHPPADLAQSLFRVSMPASLEGFIRQLLPQSERMEFCHNDRHIVVHRGWSPLAPGCVPGEGDTVIALN
jgi:hypothetical protein